MSSAARLFLLCTLSCIPACIDDSDEQGTGFTETGAPSSSSESGSNDDHVHSPKVPRAYLGLFNPFDGLAGAAQSGAQFYASHCATCHGSSGLGDGALAASLKPTAAILRGGHIKNAKDDYLYYRIAEGGLPEPFHSQMPAFKDALSSEQIWHIVSFLRTLAADAPPHP